MRRCLSAVMIAACLTPAVACAQSVRPASPSDQALHVKTNQPYEYEGKLLPPGSYLDVTYADADNWVIRGYINPPLIPKSSAELVPYIKYDQMVLGRTNRKITVQDYFQNLTGDHSNLNHSTFGAKTLPVGQEMYLLAKEEDCYLAMVPVAHGFSVRARIPASAITVFTGSPDAGVSLVPPLKKDVSAR